jgi:hypothetical protein
VDADGSAKEMPFSNPFRNSSSAGDLSRFDNRCECKVLNSLAEQFKLQGLSIKAHLLRKL